MNKKKQSQKEIEKEKQIQLEKEKEREIERTIEKEVLTDLQEGMPFEMTRYIPKYPSELFMNIVHSLQKDKGYIENIKFATGGGKLTGKDNKAKITYMGEEYLNTL